jgi:hypothetical protein
MPDTTDRGPGGNRRAKWLQRLGWFVLLYAAGLAVTLLVAYGLRAIIPGQ